MPSRVTFGEPFTAQCKVRERRRAKETVAEALLFDLWLLLTFSPLTPLVARLHPCFQLINLSTQPVVWQLGFDEARVSLHTVTRTQMQTRLPFLLV
jgi:hypothetical protein